MFYLSFCSSETQQCQTLARISGFRLRRLLSHSAKNVSPSACEPLGRCHHGLHRFAEGVSCRQPNNSPLAAASVWFPKGRCHVATSTDGSSSRRKKFVVSHHSLNTVGGVEVAGGQHRVLEVSTPWGLVFFGAETSLEVFVCVWEFA